VKELQAIVQHLTAPGAKSGVLATLVTVEGSSYRRPGARLLVTADGRRIGSISGGCLEEDVLARAHAVAAGGKPELVLYDTSSENDLVWGVGLGCHGVVQVLLEKLPANPEWVKTLSANLGARRATDIEVIWRSAGARAPLGTRLASPSTSTPSDAGIFRQTLEPPVSLVIFGAGDDAQPLVGFAKQLGWHVTVADPRPAFATAPRFPEADALVVGPAAELVGRIDPGPATLAVVMTHHYVHDVPLLRALLARPLAYLGLLGPKKRADKIAGDLTADGFVLTPEMQARLHAPVGLDLGAETSGEVALAIMAEMQAALGQRDARPLRERTGSIHGIK
jgi:xanthine/CO dehydrogenase XdhC/CoxF family maturation factor